MQAGKDAARNAMIMVEAQTRRLMVAQGSALQQWKQNMFTDTQLSATNQLERLQRNLISRLSQVQCLECLLGVLTPLFADGNGYCPPEAQASGCPLPDLCVGSVARRRRITVHAHYPVTAPLTYSVLLQTKVASAGASDQADGGCCPVGSNLRQALAPATAACIRPVAAAATG